MSAVACPSLMENRKSVLRLSLFLEHAVFLFFLLLLCARVASLSWVEEDAYIPFRVVDNLLHGYGLRWNINERVQTYTDPLWMLLHIPLYALTGNIVVTTLLLSGLCVIGILWIAARTFAFSPQRYTALLLIPLLVSPAQMLYFTSGQENVFLGFLFICFGYVIVRRPPRYWFWLGFWTGASAWTRLDSILLYAPVWLCLICSHRSEVRWRQVIAGMLPFWGWLAFSLFYFGFIFPNTGLAKLGGGVPLHYYLQSGIAYTLDFILADPWTASLIGAGAIHFPLCAWKRRLDERSSSSSELLAAAFAAGIVLYCFYVIRIGGYQIGLRMFTLPAMAACWLWLWRFPHQSRKSYACFALAAIIANVGLALSEKERFAIPLIGACNIRGEPFGDPVFIRNDKPFYYHDFRKEPFSFSGYHLNRDYIRRGPDRSDSPLRTEVGYGIGRGPYWSGPNVIYIDLVGLSEPLLARLPAFTGKWGWVGHVGRTVPTGYIEAVETGSTRNMHPDLAQYYEKLRLLTQGDLWSRERIVTIVRFNLGDYDYLRDNYVKQAYIKEKQLFDY